MSKNNPFKNSGWWILSIISLLPLVLWFIEAKIFSATASLGNILGLVGFATFAVVIVLSARFKFFEKFFNGINEVYTAHHIFGGMAFCLLLFHPLLLVYNYLQISFREAALFLLPSSYWAQNFGIIALFLMIITLLITFYLKLKYQIWRFTHKFMGVAFIFAFLHVFLIGSDVSSNLLLRGYLFVLGILAICVYLYRIFFADYFHLVKTFRYSIKSLKAYPDKIWEIEFEPVQNRKIEFLAGQFAFIKIFSRALSTEPHPFTFSSAPGQPLRIAVKELGDYTNKIGELKAGDEVLLEGPFGAFNFRNHISKKQVWVAGGVGIAPFLSMLRSLTSEDQKYEIDLYFSVRDKNCLAFQDEIKSVAEKNKNLNVFFWTADIEGFINADSIKEKTPDINKRDILICGPNSMMLALKKQFLNKGVAKERIHTEEFELY